MIPRPRIRMPIWVAAALVAAAYLIRSAYRGMDFRLDWPADAVALGLFAVVVIMVVYVRQVIARDDADAETDRRDETPAPPAE